MVIDIFTDGGCSGNPGPGGWAWIAVADDLKTSDAGGERQTTNNRMELTAVIRALESLEQASSSRQVKICTDSQYVQLGISKWIASWERNGWKTSDKKPVKNQDLWLRLRELTAQASVEWAWVKGHAGHPLNEECDAMVKNEIRKIMNK